MAEYDDDERHLTPTMPPWGLATSPTLLEQAAPTDPLVLKAFRDRRYINLHYSALGQVAAMWAQFEATVDQWLWDFAGLQDEVGLCFTGQMIGPNPRARAFIALVRHLGADPAKWDKTLNTFAKDAGRLGGQRNRILHDVWRMDKPETPYRREATAERRVKYLDLHVPTADVLAKAQEIADFTTAFQEKIAIPLFHELRPSPGTTQQAPGR
jgi:hypothetical protein